MKKQIFFKIFCSCLISIFILVSCQTKIVDTRYFDSAEKNSNELRLTILYPSVSSLKALINLKDKNIFNPENLTIIGVYHENEKTNYENSIQFVLDNNLNWIKFHKISGDINRKNLYQQNECSGEFKKIFDLSDGLIFFGGGDIPPELYGQKQNLLCSTRTPYRHFLELSFIFHLLGGFQNDNYKGFLESNNTFPILGICLGAQSLNVGTGGTMVQDIWSEKYGKLFLEDVVDLGNENWHTNPLAKLYPEENLLSYFLHPIVLLENSKFITDISANNESHPLILSAHHQMIEQVGKGFNISATSLDGKVPETFNHDHFPNVLGVQFHPEFPILWDSNRKFRFTPEDKKSQSLFTILENNPPSLDFHKKIWSWFAEKLLEQYKDK